MPSDVPCRQTVVVPPPPKHTGASRPVRRPRPRDCAGAGARTTATAAPAPAVATTTAPATTATTTAVASVPWREGPEAAGRRGQGLHQAGHGRVLPAGTGRRKVCAAAAAQCVVVESGSCRAAVDPDEGEHWWNVDDVRACWKLGGAQSRPGNRAVLAWPAKRPTQGSAATNATTTTTTSTTTAAAADDDAPTPATPATRPCRHHADQCPVLPVRAARDPARGQAPEAPPASVASKKGRVRTQLHLPK